MHNKTEGIERSHFRGAPAAGQRKKLFLPGTEPRAGGIFVYNECIRHPEQGGITTMAISYDELNV